MRAILLLVALCCVTGNAVAGPSTIPEPGVLELLSIGGIAGLIVAIRKHRK